VPSSAKLKDLIGTSNPPKHDNGTDMCLSFLLRQGCWSNCKRANQHTSVLSANEQRRLQEYLQQRLPTLTTASVLGTQGTAPSTSG
jgi:hypothetical protein